MNNNVIIKIVDFQSDLQQASVDLRTRVLRTPLGLSFSKDELLAENNQIHIVAILDTIVVGTLLLQAINASTVKMRQVAVDDQFQNKGIGKMLVQFTENYTQQNQYKIIELHARLNAVPFYEKLAYQKIGDEFTEVNIPHYKMIKNIGY
ncbi:MAG: GNAT family N-acetyltransferase [Chitinophagales bacterium]|nr:GNAT family N-acetyltransferase [Chitinophagales bacterium]